MRWSGGVIPFKHTKNGINIYRKINLANPRYESGVLFQRTPGHRYPGWHLIADISGQMMAWGVCPIPETPMEVYVKRDQLRPRAKVNRSYYHWTVDGVYCPRNVFKMRKAASTFPKRSTHRKCVGCDGQSYWVALSYLGGSTRCRTYGFCVDCTLGGGQNIKPSGRMVCRICRDSHPDVILYSEKTDWHGRGRHAVWSSAFQVPIHHKCRPQLFKIQQRMIAKWHPVPPTLKVYLG